MNKSKWNAGILDEVKFWESWFTTKGLEWPDDYNFRLDPNTELQPYLKQLVEGKSNPNILDVGAGPLTFMGKNINGVPVNIMAFDALAAQYNIIMHRHGITPPVRTIYKESEDIHELFGYFLFDLIVAQNTLDHSHNPLKAILSMPTLLQPDGVIYLNHYSKTGENEKYLGLHQWNFYLDNGKLMLSSDGVTYNVIEEINQIHANNYIAINTYIPETNQIVTLIRKEQ